jgi:hypothetical protein
MKKRFIYILVLFFVAAFISCSKDSELAPEYFYGQWKTSYGDTVIFSRKNGMNIATYNYSMNSLFPTRGDHEFAYRDGKLGLKISSTSDFNFLGSFKWIQPGQSFEVQGIEWFSFLSSTLGYFTFTKLP